MVELIDVVGDYALLEEMIGGGYVSLRRHPEFPELGILNYTEKAAFERVWNQVTNNTRGLIFNTKTYEVLARPFQKIHNWDEPEAPAIDWDRPVYHWSNKEDGSLGIIYERPYDGDQWETLEVATRGSFESDQAKHATEWLSHGPAMKRFAVVEWAWDMVEAGYTPLVEIVYPENRIVLDYSGRDELIPLGCVHNESGYFVPYAPAEPRSFRTLVTDLARKNAEGWVVWVTPYKAVKIKQPDYVELHRIVTGLNRKSVWRALKDGEPTFRALLEQLPDELYKWAEDVARGLREEYAGHVAEIDYWYIRALDTEWDYRDSDEPSLNRRQFALAVQDYVPPLYRGFMFSLLDGKDIQDKVWAMIEPKGGDR